MTEVNVCIGLTGIADMFQWSKTLYLCLYANRTVILENGSREQLRGRHDIVIIIWFEQKKPNNYNVFFAFQICIRMKHLN